MTRGILATMLVLAGAAVTAASADVGRLPRNKVANAEKLVSTQLAAMFPDEPFFLLGQARGIYLEGYGVVFSADVNLATGPTLNPFHQEITHEEIARHRDKKMSRLPMLRTTMASIMGTASAVLDTLPPSEQVVLAVTLLRYPYEDAKGMPSQIVMQADRAKLVDAQKRHVALDTVIRTQEY
jgi:hypothetical protein